MFIYQLLEGHHFQSPDFLVLIFSFQKLQRYLKLWQIFFMNFVPNPLFEGLHQGRAQILGNNYTVYLGKKRTKKSVTPTSYFARY